MPRCGGTADASPISLMPFLGDCGSGPGQGAPVRSFSKVPCRPAVMSQCAGEVFGFVCKVICQVSTQTKKRSLINVRTDRKSRRTSRMGRDGAAQRTRGPTRPPTYGAVNFRQPDHLQRAQNEQVNQTNMNRLSSRICDLIFATTILRWSELLPYERGDDRTRGREVLAVQREDAEASSRRRSHLVCPGRQNSLLAVRYQCLPRSQTHSCFEGASSGFCIEISKDKGTRL